MIGKNQEIPANVLKRLKNKNKSRKTLTDGNPSYSEHDVISYYTLESSYTNCISLSWLVVFSNYRLHVCSTIVLHYTYLLKITYMTCFELYTVSRFNLRQRNISETKIYRKKCFKQKLYSLEGDICCRPCLWWRSFSCITVSLVFLNGNSHLLLWISIVRQKSNTSRSRYRFFDMTFPFLDIWFAD